MATKTDAKGATLHYNYDAYQRLTSIPELQETFTYDTCPSTNATKCHRMSQHAGPACAGDVLIDRRVEPDKWATLLTSSWYDTGDVKYENCRIVGPGQTIELPEIRADVILEKRNNSAGSRVTLRFHLDVPCPEGEQRVVHPLVTDPVAPQIPNH